MYLIDGYNLFYQKDFANRDELVGALTDFCDYKGKKAHIVFDGYSPEDLSTISVQVEFAGDADARIAEIVKMCHTPSYYVLISSDRELLNLAKQKGIKFKKSEDFDFLRPRPIETEPGEEPNPLLTDKEVEEQLEEFENFKKAFN